MPGVMAGVIQHYLTRYEDSSEPLGACHHDDGLQ